MRDNACDIDNCPNPARARGLCRSHYMRNWRYGTPTAGGPEAAPVIRHIPDRFWSRVAVSEPDDCWLWTGERNNQGYGRFCLYVPDRRVRILAHRFAHILSTAEDIGDAVLLHTCDTPLCCNPSHLRCGTQAENMRDARLKGRMNLSGLALGRGRRGGGLP